MTPFEQVEELIRMGKDGRYAKALAAIRDALERGNKLRDEAIVTDSSEGAIVVIQNVGAFEAFESAHARVYGEEAPK